MDKDKSEMAEALERIISIVKDPQSIDFLKIQAIAEHALTTAKKQEHFKYQSFIPPTAKAMPCHCGATGYSIICPECGMITKEG